MNLIVFSDKPIDDSSAPLLSVALNYDIQYQMSRLMTKPTKVHVRPTKTQISLGILPV